MYFYIKILSCLQKIIVNFFGLVLIVKNLFDIFASERGKLSSFSDVDDVDVPVLCYKWTVYKYDFCLFL